MDGLRTIWSFTRFSQNEPNTAGLTPRIEKANPFGSRVPEQWQNEDLQNEANNQEVLAIRPARRRWFGELKDAKGTRSVCADQ
jgi:hypothetical protein